MRASILLISAFAAVAFSAPRGEAVVGNGDEVAHEPLPSLTVGRPLARGDYTRTAKPEDHKTDSSTPTPLPISEFGGTPVLEVDTVEQLQVRAAQSPVATLYRQAAMQRHNVHRANHGAGPVTWSAKLERAAMKSAQRCTFAHFMSENGLTYGQNLALGLPANKIAAIISDQWYYPEVGAYASNYGEAQPDYGDDMDDFEKWGHFTQLVWKDSMKIGCATWKCDSIATSETDSTPLPSSYGGDITYCNYKSEGNFAGEYAANVGAPRSSVKVKANSNVNLTAIATSYSKWTGQKW